jgi:hypothetical protein
MLVGGGFDDGETTPEADTGENTAPDSTMRKPRIRR